MSDTKFLSIKWNFDDDELEAWATAHGWIRKGGAPDGEDHRE